eukprot:s275_g31.t1
MLRWTAPEHFVAVSRLSAKYMVKRKHGTEQGRWHAARRSPPGQEQPQVAVRSLCDAKLPYGSTRVSPFIDNLLMNSNWRKRVRQHNG